MLRVSLICLLVGFGFVFGLSENIHSLGKDFYQTIDSKPGPWVITFGRPTCAWTNAFNVIYEPAADRRERFGCNFGFVDCHTYPQICRHFNIPRIPEVRFFDGGEYSYTYTDSLTDYFQFAEFVKGEYVNYKRKPVPDRSTLFEEENTLDEALFQINMFYQENQYVCNIGLLLFTLIALMGTTFWIIACCCYATPKKNKDKSKKD